ncbi:magnesium transporter [Georgenia thermotolerans]|uniref:Magnesium transporter MgtE n=1 Tax=Georgenia thermotolerans TaxID=527326 RepID=A0A7J5UU68_9MICO|nr:magnesium transporter [Georgenia thermotolerans]KAE8765822.1 magnesium transporter [Georgenia thermotolerans]
MAHVGDVELEQVTRDVERALREPDLGQLTRVLAPLPVPEVVGVLERLGRRDGAVAYRLLPKDVALEVFEGLDPALQGDLVHGLQDEEVAQVFARLSPDDRVGLLDELPASVASRLLRGLAPRERELTAVVLGYPAGSLGRRMSPGYITLHPEMSVSAALHRVRSRLDDAETVYTLPVVDDERRLVGVVSLRDLMRAEGTERAVGELMQPPYAALATADAETAARRCADLKLLALLVVDEEGRLVGILTVDDALRILEDAESEDQARSAGSEPLRRPYLSTPVRTLVRSRVVWLLVLAVGATLTVQVLEVFEATLSQMVVLSVFIPLLIGTGGNTGNQAAATLTRALALDDVSPRDALRVVAREVRTGLSLGLILGGVGFAVTSLFYGASVGAVVGLTLLAICTLAATVGGVMPLVARTLHVDPAVFSNPFITTFVDATGLIIYFLIARVVLGL